DYLYKNALDQVDLFTQSGLHSEFLTLRESLDSGWPQDLNCSNHSASETLLTLLDSLMEPVIPFSLYQKSLDSSQNFTSCQDVVSSMPLSHKHVFFYIVSFLREFLRHSRSNHSDPKILGKCTLKLKQP